MSHQCNDVTVKSSTSLRFRNCGIVSGQHTHFEE